MFGTDKNKAQIRVEITAKVRLRQALWERRPVTAR